jgi:hypothetical protein
LLPLGIGLELQVAFLDDAIDHILFEFTQSEIVGAGETRAKEQRQSANQSNGVPDAPTFSQRARRHRCQTLVNPRIHLTD